MTGEENKELVRRFFEEVSNEGHLERIPEMVAPDFVNHNPAPEASPGMEGLNQGITMLRTGLPDFHTEIEDIFAEGDRVVARLTFSGTHQGQMMGRPPTGNKMSIGGIVIFRVTDGKLVERWGQLDAMGLMQQIGAVPAPGQ